MKKKEQYNPSLLLLKSVLLSVFVMFLLYLFTVYLVNGKLRIYSDIKVIFAVVIGIFAARKKMIPSWYIKRYGNKDDERSKKILKTAYLTYATAVWAVLPAGLSFFFYDVVKQNKTPVDNTPKFKKYFLLVIGLLIVLGIFIDLLFYGNFDLASL